VSGPTVLEPPSHLDGPPLVPPKTRYPGDDGDQEPGRDPRPGGPPLAVFAVWVSLVPVLMLFGALIVTYVVRKDFGEQWLSMPMPAILWLNTLALLMSSVVLEWSRRSRRREHDGFRGFQGAFALGLLFVLGQVIAWVQYLGDGIVASSTPHSGFFYVLTAVHAAHVFGGLIGLGFLALWPRHHWTFTTVPTLSRITAVYWHFLGLLWLTMFLMLEYWR
jgi:cytochrome c oxidase subunit 3